MGEELFLESCEKECEKVNFLAVHMSPPQGKRLGDVCHGNLRGQCQPWN